MVMVQWTVVQIVDMEPTTSEAYEGPHKWTPISPTLCIHVHSNVLPPFECAQRQTVHVLWQLGQPWCFFFLDWDEHVVLRGHFFVTAKKQPYPPPLPLLWIITGTFWLSMQQFSLWRLSSATFLIAFCLWFTLPVSLHYILTVGIPHRQIHTLESWLPV